MARRVRASAGVGVVDRSDAWLVVVDTFLLPAVLWLWVVGIVLVPDGAVAVVAVTAVVVLMLGEFWLSRRNPPIADRVTTRRNLPDACACLGWPDRSPRRLIVASRAAGWAAFAVVVAAVGVRVLSSGVGRWAVAGVVLFVAVVVVPVLVIDAYLAHRRFVTVLSAGEFAFEPGCGVVPTNIDAVVDELRALGFRELTRGRWVVTRHRPIYEVRMLRGDGIVARAASRSSEPKRARPSFFSLLGDHLGVLETTSTQGSLSATNELTQVFPHATTAELLAHHEDALAFLVARHLDAARLEDEQVPAFLAWSLTNAGVHHPQGRGVLRRVLLLVFRVEDRGPIAEHADTAEKLAVIRST